MLANLKTHLQLFINDPWDKGWLWCIKYTANLLPLPPSLTPPMLLLCSPLPAIIVSCPH